jgi:hypothetical protein
MARAQNYPGPPLTSRGVEFNSPGYWLNSRSSLPRSGGPAYDRIPMRPASSLPLIALLIFAPGCASQTQATEHQVRDLEARIKRISANSERMEERILALEAATQSGPSGRRDQQDVNAARPELPVVRVDPNGQKFDTASDAERPPDGATDDSRRLVIVGEGSRVEARTASETSPAAGVRSSSPVNSRASKGISGSFSPASTGSAPK